MWSRRRGRQTAPSLHAEPQASTTDSPLYERGQCSTYSTHAIRTVSACICGRPTEEVDPWPMSAHPHIRIQRRDEKEMGFVNVAAPRPRLGGRGGGVEALYVSKDGCLGRLFSQPLYEDSCMFLATTATDDNDDNDDDDDDDDGQPSPSSSHTGTVHTYVTYSVQYRTLPARVTQHAGDVYALSSGATYRLPQRHLTRLGDTCLLHADRCGQAEGQGGCRLSGGWAMAFRRFGPVGRPTRTRTRAGCGMPSALGTWRLALGSLRPRPRPPLLRSHLRIPLTPTSAVAAAAAGLTC